MYKKIILISILFFTILFSFSVLEACRKDQNTRKLETVLFETPAGFPQPVHSFAGNPLSREGFELGRKLFYDGRLSIDNEHPCSSCHQQIGSFGTFEHDRSHGVHDSHTLRNAPVLVNLAWNKGFHWDGKYISLEDAIAHPINGAVEMGETYSGVIEKLEKDPEYRSLFKKVFRYPFIRPEFIMKALAQFTGLIISADSKYDRYKKGLDLFSAQEERGYQLFRSYCAVCHIEPLFTDQSFRNTGLSVDPFLTDFGMMRVTGKKTDSLKFKVPTLRNVSVSSNYMHDGRFNTLFQCINHYRTGIQQSATLDPLLRNGIPLSNTETNDLIVFLRTLTDSALLKNTRFQEP